MSTTMRTTLHGLLMALAGLTTLAALAGHPSFAAQPGDDPDKSARWLDFREGTFKDRPIDAHGDSVIRFDAPARAADAAVVPVSITAQFPQTPSRYIKKLYMFIDENPEPYVGWFEFTPESGLASLETRVRVEDYTYMRVIAETNDGHLYSAVRFIKASGGCSAPAGKDDAAAEANAGQVRLQPQGPSTPGKPQLVQLMVRHPNRTGMAMDQVTRLYASAYFVRKVAVTYADKPVMTANVNFSISENPNFRFYFVPHDGGVLKAHIEDTKNRQFDSQVAIGPHPAAQQTSSATP